MIYTQVTPPVRSDSRTHLLNRNCWCRPVVDSDRLVHNDAAPNPFDVVGPLDVDPPKC